MDKTRNKLWRRRHQWRLFKAKLVIFSSYPTPMTKEDGTYLEHPHWFDYIGKKWFYKYKTVRTPCSCELCKGESYNRIAFRKETLRILKESQE